jgi:hypothetical protein
VAPRGRGAAQRRHLRADALRHRALRRQQLVVGVLEHEALLRRLLVVDEIVCNTTRHLRNDS